MGLFGGTAGGLTGAQKLQLFGATLRDTGAGFGGEDGGAIKAFQAQQMLVKKQAEQAALMRDLFGGSAPAPAMPASPQVEASMTGPISVGLDTAALNAPRLPAPKGPQTLREAAPLLGPAILAGIPGADKLVDLFDKTGPQIDVANGVTYDKRNIAPGTRVGVNGANVNGHIVDYQDPASIGRFFGEAPAKGAEPVYNQARQQVGWHMADGSIQAMQAAAQAQAAGTAAGGAPFDMIKVPQSDGSEVMMPKSQFLGGAGPRMAGPGSGAPRIGVSQSPADAAAAKIRAEGAATAAVGLPQVEQTAGNAVSLIDKMLAHPSLGARTGMSGMLPAFPGTPDAGFDAMGDQLKGKVFLEAFQSLKGAGQITEVEGQKATDAIGRLNRAQSSADYTAALKELQGVIGGGLERARRQANPVASGGGRGGYSVVTVRRAGQ